jgi:mannan endo-1,4-beta-mannosidase
MKKLAAAGALAGTVLLSGCASALAWKAPEQPVSQGVPGSVPVASVPTPRHMLVGAYESSAPQSWGQLATFSTATGIKPRIAEYFSGWPERFRGTFAETAWQHGAYTFVEMEPDNVSVTSIAAGGQDGYLRSYAQAVRTFGHPVLLSFGHEMNGTWYTWGNGHVAPATFVAAWRHVVDVFREAGATNVTWVWVINAIDGTHGPLRPWWPGSAWVNWVGIDGYYYTFGNSFDSVFGQTIAEVRTFSNAPVMISETAVGTTADRETQIKGLIAGARTEHATALVWFDSPQSLGLYHQNWRLEDDPAALAAFKTAMREEFGL